MSDTDDADLDEALYLVSNPDVAHAFDAGLIPRGRAHWRDAGRDEAEGGARPTLVETVPDSSIPSVRIADPAFDAALYLDMNADLRAAFGGDLDAARRHWAEHGSLEGRYGAGDAPHRARSPDLAALLARPFGVDLYLPVEEREPGAAAARRLLLGLRRASVPVSLRPFVDRDDIPRIPASATPRPAFRISLIAAAPQTLRRLLRAYPDGHFDASYVIGFWPNLALTAHWPDYPTFGAVDELWVPAASLRDRLASVSPVPVRFVRLAAALLPSREAARSQLGLPPEALCLMLDAELVGDGQGGLCPPAHLFAVISAWRPVSRTARPALLVVRANARSLEAADQASHGLADVVVVTDQRNFGHGSLVLAACDAMIASPGLDADIADASAAGTAIIAPTRQALETFRGGGSAPPQPPLERGGSIRDLLASLGLDAPAPRFAAHLGRSRHACLPVPSRSAPVRPAIGAQAVSILLDARASRRADIEQTAAMLAGGPHPFWELCIAGLSRAEAWRDRLPADPRVRLAPAATLATSAATLNQAVAYATGSHVIIARSIAEALAAAGALAAIVSALAPDLDALLVADPTGSPVGADRIQAGGALVRPVALRLSALHAAGGFRDQTGPAAEFDLLLRIKATGGRIAFCPAAEAPSRDPDPPGADEAGRLVLHAHLQATAGPLAYAESGLRAGTYRRRTHATRKLAATVVIPADSALDQTDLPDARLIRTARLFAVAETDLDTEHVVILDHRIAQIAPGALTALLEFTHEQEIGAVGARILHADTTLHHAGLVLSPDGSLRVLGHGQPNDPAGPAPAFTVANPDAIGGGVLATRRSTLLHAGGFDRSLLDASGVTFDLLAADLCLRLARDLGLRTTYTPFAVFHRSPTPHAMTSVAPPTDAERLFRSRWGLVRPSKAPDATKTVQIA